MNKIRMFPLAFHVRDYPFHMPLPSPYRYAEMPNPKRKTTKTKTPMKFPFRKAVTRVK